VEYLGFPAFFDVEPTSQTRRERLESYPGCDEWLGLLAFVARKQPR
jgi:hypothetical protein